MKTAIFLTCLSCAWVLPRPAVAEDYEARTFKGPEGKTLPYRLMKPDNYEKGKRYPLVLILHGFGQRGTDNKKQIEAKTNGAPSFLKADVRKKYPCFVVVPQAPSTWVNIPDFNKTTPFREQPLDSVMLTAGILQALTKEFSVDADRVYLMGYSNGGCGAWDMLVRAPKFWAGAVICAGAGDPALIGVAKGVPVWVFHSVKDETVPIDRARDMIAALKKAGGQPKFTEYPTANHYDTGAKAHGNPELLEWLFAQKRGKPAEASSGKAKKGAK